LAWVLVAGLAGCTEEPDPVALTPAVAPSHQIAGSVLPWRVGDYTALGPTPAPGQDQVTYANDARPLDLVVVTFDPTSRFAEVELTDAQWYGVSRCGQLWQSDSDASPIPSQSACVSHLTDGLMTTVGGGQQTPFELSQLANTIVDGLA
jgi:hypothetical protein